MALLEERRKKLQAEGLFDPARKKRIPYLPRVIGVVTSPTGAVIRDILHRLRDRFPSRVLVWPVRVQGEGAAEEVAAAIRGFNAILPGGRIPRPDLLIIARGGGSIEDLWAFNEEVSVRAVAASRIPTIAAVGHETDWTLIDHVADLRAPTPTGAAEMAIPVRIELLAATRDLASRHQLAHRRRMETWRRDFLALYRTLPTLNELLALRRQKLDEISGRLGRSLKAEVSVKRKGYDGLAPRLAPLLLDRAFARNRERLGLLSTRVSAARAAGLRDAARRFHAAAARHDLDSVARLVARQRQRLEQDARLLRSYSYEAVLDRGYALVIGPGGNAVRSADQVSTGDPLMIRVASGDFGATVSGPGRPKSRRSLPRSSVRPEQGKLF
jgi:exodeoxyribonuclease VII large subunit